MLGLKSFRTAAVVISGIELAEKIKKGQYKILTLVTCAFDGTEPALACDRHAVAERATGSIP